MKICLLVASLLVDYFNMSLNKILNEIKEFSESENEEVCGIIYKKNRRFLFKKCKNTELKRQSRFEISSKDYLDIYKEGDIVSIFHSHPIGKSGLSKSDMIHSDYLDIPFLMYENETKKFYLHEVEDFKYLKSLKKALSCVK